MRRVPIVPAVVALALPPQEAAREPAPVALALPEGVTAALTGRVFLDAGWFDTGGDRYVSDEPGATELEDGTEIRSARLGVRGALHGDVRYHVEYDLAEGADEDEVVARDVWMALAGTPAGELRAGHFREPFGLEQATSLTYSTFLERSLLDAFAPGFNAGVALFGADRARDLAWSAGIYRTTDESGSALADGEHALTARLSGTGWNRAGGTELLHLGAALSYREDDVVRFAARPEAHLVAPVADTGPLRADDTTLMALESAWVGGPWSAQAEYVVASVAGGSGTRDVQYSGIYAFASWFVTGEHRVYVPERGAFGRVVPHASFTGAGGVGPGAVELAARFSLLELDGGALSEELRDATLGANWYWNANARVMLDVVRSEFDDLAEGDSAWLLVVRFQVDW